ncbi:MAG: glycosyltransferase N-terminal domain-containing protein [Calditrichota bacterium]|jgi:3-deoxy-D-manno-octulosonic-acid transferase
MTLIFFLIYNFIFVPVFFLLIHLAAIFNPKLRKGVWGRYWIQTVLRRVQKEWGDKQIVVIHCASMGEFEHIKPLLLGLKERKPEIYTIVLFFSPSGYENVKTFPAVDLFLYSPFEWVLPIWRFVQKVKPTVWIIAKHDVWPDQVWFARLFDIPCVLINASLHEQSSRLLWFTRKFHQSIYQYFSKILAISESDRLNFLKLAEPSQIIVAGDTKYDQVLYRNQEFSRINIIPDEVKKNRWIFVAGSTWPEDQVYLIKAITPLMRANGRILTIICPHEPTEQHLQEIVQNFRRKEIILLSDIKNYSDQSVILIDRIGVLANIYGLGKVAYVGGSFKQNVHNVLEPAVYKIPVIFGPVNRNSHEAQLLKANRGGWEVHNATEIEFLIRKFLLNDVYRQESGLKAYQIVEDNRGATKKTVEHILSYLK